MQFYFFWSLNINIAVHLMLYMIDSASSQLYVGCYTNFSGSSSINNPIQSVFQCLNDCRNRTSLFAAVKGGSSCYCGNITNTRVPSSNCNLPCGDNNGTCGGNNFYAVYIDIPSYQGCFDRFSRPGGMSYFGFIPVDRCYDRCMSLNFRFYGVQVRYWIFIECFCGDNYGSHERSSESECEICFEDTNFKCGSDFRKSIYSVGHLPSLNKSYGEVFHCLGGVTEKNGTCNSTNCKYGWKGAKCNQRDCERNNGNCGDHKCEDINIGNQNISECVCNEGFQSISVYDECTDLDECPSNPCNEPSETCINTFGSFMCTCSPGYKYAYQSDCGVHCNGSLYSCDNSTSCNKLSNYICSLEIKDADRKAVIILGVFLALCICALIIYTVAMFFYKKKLKDTESRLEQLKKTIQDEGMKSSASQLPNQYREEHNYAKLGIQEIYEN